MNILYTIRPLFQLFNSTFLAIKQSQKNINKYVWLYYNKAVLQTHKKHSFLPTDHNLSTFALHQGVEGSSYACLAFCSHALKNLFSVGTLRDKPSPRRELNFKSTKFYISFVCCTSILDADTVNAKPGWCIDISWPYIWVSDPLVKFSACRLLISHSLEENLSFPATSLPRDLNSHPKS